MARRAPHVELVLCASPVQGADAPDALVRAIGAAGTLAGADLVIVCRGGGSIEDLWAFNDERVVRAIVASPVPVISGVGHETDVTLADFAADLRAPTPTAAAELATPANADCAAALVAVAATLRRRLQATLDTQSQRIDRAAQRLARPAVVVHRRRHALDLLSQRLQSVVRHDLAWRSAALDRQRRRLPEVARMAITAQFGRAQTVELRLHANDPRRVLERGYAWLIDAEGRPIQSVAQMTPAHDVTAVLADGKAELRVVSTTPSLPG